MEKTTKFNIQCIAEDLVSYVIQVLQGNEKDNMKPAPKKFRGDYIPMLRNKSQEILNLIVLANNLALTGEDSNEFTRQKRVECQQLALANCAVLDIDLLTAQRVGCITMHQLEVATGHTYNLSSSLRNWISGDRRRLQDELSKQLNKIIESN